MKIISHRGGMKIAPENSLKSIQKSRELGVDAIEIDIRLSRDKKMVVFHDKTLLRLAHSSKAVSDLDFDELLKMELNNGEHIISFDQAISAVKDTPLIVEGKSSGWAKILSDRIKNYKYRKTLRVISFNERELNKFKKLNKDVECFQVNLFNGYKAISSARRGGFEGIAIMYPGVFNPRIFKLAKNNHLKVNVYTVNHNFLAKIIRKLYPDVEITTDSPHKLVRLKKTK